MKKLSYQVDKGDGRWILNEDGNPIKSTTGTEIAFCFDQGNGALFKHGDPERVKAWMTNSQAKYRKSGFNDMADDIVMLTGHSHPLCGEPRPGVIYLTEDEVNRCISCSGSILKIAARHRQDHNTIDVVAIEIIDSTPQG